MVVGERHLGCIVHCYLDYYHCWRTHLWLAQEAPEPRPVQPPERGEVIQIGQVAGLHQR